MIRVASTITTAGGNSISMTTFGWGIATSFAANEERIVHDSTPAIALLDGRDVELKGIAGRHRLYALAPPRS